MGLGLLSVGALFKIAAVPFHYWTPDAYQGSPTPVTGYLSTGPKIAAFALILRLFVEALTPLRGEWAVIIGVLAAITMTVGNLAALGQDNIKRMLAYSSIAHTGYIMVGLVVFATAPRRGSGRGGRPERPLLRGRLRLHEPGRLRRGGRRCNGARVSPARSPPSRASATGPRSWP